MVQRFLFDRVDAEAAGITIRQQHNFTAYNASNRAQTPLPLSHFASAWAYVALNATIFNLVPVFSGNDSHASSLPRIVALGNLRPKWTIRLQNTSIYAGARNLFFLHLIVFIH
jgi:hypothetical protein